MKNKRLGMPENNHQFTTDDLIDFMKQMADILDYSTYSH